MTRRTLVSIIGMNRREGTLECIEALLTSACPCDLVLTDQNSHDGTSTMMEEVKTRAPATVVFHESSNTGFQHPGNRAFEMAILGGYEFLLLLNDDLIVPRSFLLPLIACFDRDAAVVLAGTSCDVCCQLDEQFRGGPGSRLDYVEGSLLLIHVAKLKAMFGWTLFAPELHHIYCLVPETPVLKSDLRWVQLGTLKQGDELIGVDEMPPGFGGHRRYKPSVVTEVKRRVAECFEIAMEDGRSVTCTAEHLWLTKLPPPSNTQYTWRKTDKLSPGFRISTPLDTWSDGESFDHGWMSGILDGEGCVIGGASNSSARTHSVVFSQNERVVLERAFRLLREMKIPFTKRPHNSGPDKVVNVEISARRFAIKLLGMLRPTRLLLKARRVWEGHSLKSRKYPNDMKIVSIRPVGEKEVVTIETTLKTFIANGMVSHNCEDTDLSLRVQERGGRITTAPVKVRHARSSTTHADPAVKELCRQSEEHNRAYCLKRWAHWLRFLRHDYPILVRRKAALGDVVMSTAVIREIKKARPLCSIFVETGVPEVFNGNPNVFGAYKAIPSPSPECLIVDLDMAYENRPMTHVIDAYAEVAREAVPGLGEVEHRTEMFPSEEDNGWAGMTRNRFCGHDDKLALIHAGKSHWPGKQPKDELFIKVIQQLLHRGWKVATIGAQNVEFPGAVNLTGRTSIMQLAALFRFAQLCVTIDSGPLHVALANGCPTVGVFGCTSARYLMSNGAPHAFAEADASIPCAGERHRTTGEAFHNCSDSCILSVSVESVMMAISKLEL